MNLFSLTGNSQQLDGGAMFGNVPKTMWSQWITPDSANRIKLACRCLLVQHQGKNILLEAGIGAFFEPRLKERYGVIESEHMLLKSLAAIGLSHEQIDIIILSHLHFDHAGGLLSAWSPQQVPTLLFPNAQYIVSKVAWERAISPHPRDKASFIPGLNKLLADSNRLEIIEPTSFVLNANFSFHISEGHTPGMLLTEVSTDKGPLIFAADLIPGAAWVHVPVTMGYDRFPELVINEKQRILDYLAANQGHLFFTHDPTTVCTRIKLTADNKFVLTDPICKDNEKIWH